MTFCRTNLLVVSAIAVAIMGCSDSKSSAPANTAAGAPQSSAPLQAGMPTVPTGASEVAHGSGDLTYKAKDDGLLYLSDESINRVVTRKRVRAGQNFEFSPSTGFARIDGKIVFQQTYSANHQFKLFFEKE